MARTLKFEFNNDSVEVGLEKVERKKIYGWVDKKAYTREGQECQLGSISSDGAHIFGKESFEQGYVDQNGEWLEKSNLVALNNDQEIIEKIPSSFKASIKLDNTMSVDDYLLYMSKSVYQLEANPALLERVKSASPELFYFDYCYIDSYSADVAFLLTNEDSLFMVVGEPTNFDFIGLSEIESFILLEDDEEEEGDDEMDFGML